MYTLKCAYLFNVFGRFTVVSIELLSDVGAHVTMPKKKLFDIIIHFDLSMQLIRSYVFHLYLLEYGVKIKRI